MVLTDEDSLRDDSSSPLEICAGENGNQLNRKLVENAVEALLKYAEIKEAERKKNSLFSDGEFITAQILLWKRPEIISLKPAVIKVPYPIMDKCEVRMCLFVREENIMSIEKQMEKTPVQGLKKIMSIKQLVKEYKSVKDKSELLYEYDIFLCDYRVSNKMTRLLGKTFISKNKQPVCIAAANINEIAKNIAKVRDNAQIRMSHGPCWGIKLGTTLMSKDKIVSNVIEGVRNSAFKVIPGKWENVKAVHLSTSQSPSFPIYASLADEKDLNLDEVIKTKPKEKRKLWLDNENSLKAKKKNTKMNIEEDQLNNVSVSEKEETSEF